MSTVIVINEQTGLQFLLVYQTYFSFDCLWCMHICIVLWGAATHTLCVGFLGGAASFLPVLSGL